MSSEEPTRALFDALETMHERGGEIRERELETALGKLDDPDDRTRAVLEAMTERLVGSILRPPTGSLLAAAADGDEDRSGTALALFEGRHQRVSGTTDDEQSPPVFARAQD